MYAYKFDDETGGLLLTDTEERMSKEPRPVYAAEMNILGFDRRWHYDIQNDVPYIWAEAGNYFYRGKKIAVVKGGSLYEKPQLEFVELTALPKVKRFCPSTCRRCPRKILSLWKICGRQQLNAFTIIGGVIKSDWIVFTWRSAAAKIPSSYWLGQARLAKIVFYRCIRRYPNGISRHV